MVNQYRSRLKLYQREFYNLAIAAAPLSKIASKETTLVYISSEQMSTEFSVTYCHIAIPTRMAIPNMMNAQIYICCATVIIQKNCGTLSEMENDIKMAG